MKKPKDYRFEKAPMKVQIKIMRAVSESMTPAEQIERLNTQQRRYW